jgi:uncharacterized protein (DUF849 family)
MINSAKQSRTTTGLLRRGLLRPDICTLDLIAEGVLQGPGSFSLVLGVKYGFNASPETMHNLGAEIASAAETRAMLKPA